MRLMLITVVVWCISAAFAAAELVPISNGATVTSPDGRFTARLTEEDAHGLNLAITDSRTPATERARIGTPLLSMRWTFDSRTIVSIEHLAGGSQLALLHFYESGWKRIEVIPPNGLEGHFEVIRQQMHRDSVTVTYKVTKEKPNGAVASAFTCSFDVDAASGRISQLRRRRINLEMYRQLRYSP